MSKEIKLTKGKITIVDDNMYEELNKYAWYAQGADYRAARRLTVDGKSRITFIYHQILGVYSWELGERKLVVDHLNGNSADNRRENLRIGSQQLNMLNSARHIYRIGVGEDKRHSTFKAYIDNPFKKRMNIGTFKTKEKAELAVYMIREIEVSLNCQERFDSLCNNYSKRGPYRDQQEIRLKAIKTDRDYYVYSREIADAMREEYEEILKICALADRV